MFFNPWLPQGLQQMMFPPQRMIDRMVTMMVRRLWISPWSHCSDLNEHLVHTAHVIPPAPPRKRPNYDSRNRKFLSNQVDRRRFLALCLVYFSCLFFLIILPQYDSLLHRAPDPRQDLNGKSIWRVRKTLTKHCRCKRSKCFKLFNEHELVKFLNKFWSLKKTLQDAYVPPLVGIQSFMSFDFEGGLVICTQNLDTTSCSDSSGGFSSKRRDLETVEVVEQASGTSVPSDPAGHWK